MLRVRHLVAIATSVAALSCLSQSARLSAADLEMVDAFGNVTGVIDVSRPGLSVFENSGDRFFYQRAPRYDLPGGRYLGFYNLELNRIIRFPRSGNGPVERADLDAPLPRFVPATVSVRPIGSGPGFTPFLHQWLQQPGPGVPMVGLPGLGTGQYGSVPGVRYGNRYGQLSSGYVAGYTAGGNQFSGIELGVNPLAAGGFSAGPLSAGPLSGLRPRQPTAYQPRSVLLESKLVNKPNLPPAEVDFFNSSRDPLIVTLTDARNPGKQPQYQLPPGDRQRVILPRDSGQTRVDVYQTTDVSGLPIEQEIQVAVPSQPRYEVVVHRVRIQSIAIDRTGKSPNPIEDINTQGIGLGRFQLPPGDELASGVIDVYEAASAAENRGTVAPIPLNR